MLTVQSENYEYMLGHMYGGCSDAFVNSYAAEIGRSNSS